MLATSVVFAKSVILEFMGSRWGLSAFVGVAFLLMAAGFKLMKIMDNDSSYRETYHPPR